jgi:predicted nucleic acid-binding protein
MTHVFADSFYFFALLLVGDAAHDRAVKFTSEFNGEYFTTRWVLTELADGLARPCHRRELFAEVLRDLEPNSHVHIIDGSADLWAEGVDLYQRRRDKEWSLTVCVSFVVMQKHGITDALTGDHHFEQAGFRALLK